MTDGTRTPIDDLSIGDVGPELVVKNVSRVDFAKYAGASGDFNPLHVDEEYARDAGNPSVFGHGMLTAGFAARMLTDWFGIENLDRFRVRFTERVWPDDTLKVRGEVTDSVETDGIVSVEVEFVVENQSEEAVLTGDATASLETG